MSTGPTTNPYINNVDHNISPEQNLVEDIVVESIKFNGHTFLYIPRTLVAEDEIFGEDTISRFESSHAIEMYIENVDAFEGDGDILSRFGLMVQDSATLAMAKRRFEETFRTIPNRPKEGDLVYFPLTKTLLEITFVEHENPFYQVGKNFVYRLTVELFEYGQEELDTGIEEIDSVEDRLDNPNDTINDPFADNDSFEQQGDLLKDFDPDDPFGDF